MTEEQTALDSFGGVARLFPLPNLVLFPHVDQGLHIFEHRYRQMTADALASDGLIALVLLKPDWDKDYDGNPALEAFACLSRITQHQRMPDGRYDLRVRGLARFSIETEIPDEDKLYRLASGRVLPPVVPGDLAQLAALRKSLREAVLARFEPKGSAYAQLSALFGSDAGIDEVCDELGYALPLPLAVKQSVLAEPDVTIRVELLKVAIRPPDTAGRNFPPPFSAN